MSVASMTGFARVAAEAGPWQIVWEIKSVNAKGLDVRLKLPPVFDGLTEAARARITRALARGTCFATLTATREAASSSVRVNTALIDALVAALEPYDGRTGMRAPSLGALLSVRGVIETVDDSDDETVIATASAEALDALESALAALSQSRAEEGRALADILEERLARMADIVRKADAAPGRSVEAVRARLADQVAMLLAATDGLDPQRLHQEAVLLAAKADIREELDRLTAHITAARELLAKGGPVGRRLDFLAQEFTREANTLCAKSNDIALTALGLDLKAEVEQFREQVQNVE
jgi:uncharacterized protein (TIGR00255 family)